MWIGADVDTNNQSAGTFGRTDRVRSTDRAAKIRLLTCVMGMPVRPMPVRPVGRGLVVKH
jgi:hypothetical protein